MTDDIQRSLGRIEGTQDQILAKLEQLRVDFGDHKNEDQRNFSSVRALFYDKLREQDDKREKHLAEQDAKLVAIKSTMDKAQGASWVIRAIGNGIAAVVGGAITVIAELIFKGHH